MVWRARTRGRSRARQRLSLSQADATEHERRCPGPVGTCSDAELADHIRQHIAASCLHGEGSCKLWARLRFAGVRVSPRRVRRVMRANGLLVPVYRSVKETPPNTPQPRSIVTTRNPSLPAGSCRMPATAAPIDRYMPCIRAFLQLAGSSINLVTASPVMPGGSLWVQWASCATASFMPFSRTMARHGALSCSFSACCHRVCADVISGLLRPLRWACRAARAAGRCSRFFSASRRRCAAGFRGPRGRPRAAATPLGGFAGRRCRRFRPRGSGGCR
jgi:hypothetical protein